MINRREPGRNPLPRDVGGLRAFLPTANAHPRRWRLSQPIQITQRDGANRVPAIWKTTLRPNRHDRRMCPSMTQRSQNAHPTLLPEVPKAEQFFNLGMRCSTGQSVSRDTASAHNGLTLLPCSGRRIPFACATRLQQRPRDCYSPTRCQTLAEAALMPDCVGPQPQGEVKTGNSVVAQGSGT
jgi:hypothetical protein